MLVESRAEKQTESSQLEDQRMFRLFIVCMAAGKGSITPDIPSPRRWSSYCVCPTGGADFPDCWLGKKKVKCLGQLLPFPSGVLAPLKKCIISATLPQLRYSWNQTFSTTGQLIVTGSVVLVYLTLTPSYMLKLGSYQLFYFPQVTWEAGERSEFFSWMHPGTVNSLLRPPDIWNSSGLFQLEAESRREPHLNTVLFLSSPISYTPCA